MPGYVIRLISATFVSLILFDTKEESQRICNDINLVTTIKCRTPEHLLELTLWQSSAPMNAASVAC